jgi:hypothetical protein
MCLNLQPLEIVASYHTDNKATKAMSASCSDHEPKFDGVSSGFKRTLWAVLAINAAMFVVEMMAGGLVGSQALKADALDFAGDTATYAISLAVIGMPPRIGSLAAFIKGMSLLVMSLWVAGSTCKIAPKDDPTSNCHHRTDIRSENFVLPARIRFAIGIV